MTRTTNARLAGSTFLVYIGAGIAAVVLFSPVDGAAAISTKLASIAAHTLRVRINILLSTLTIFCALVLAVTLYALTRDEDPDLALLALCCRVGEGLIGSVSVFATVGLLWLGTESSASAPDAVSTNALAVLLVKLRAWTFSISATVFAVGSALFAWLFLRARSIPVWLSGLGLAASVLLVMLLPAQTVGFLAGPVTELMWVPMLVFEVVLAFWLLIRGAAGPSTAWPANRRVV